MFPRVRTRWVAALAGVLALGLVPSCSTAEPRESQPQSQGTVPPLPEEVKRPAGRVLPNPLGLKWNWAQAETFGFLGDGRGGATFFEAEWCQIERRPGVRNWSRLDSVVERSKQLGYQLMLKIRVGSCWTSGAATRDPGEQRDTTENVKAKASGYPAHEETYEMFVRTLVLRYAERGVHMYAVENEVDTVNFWQGGYREYQRLVRLAVQAVKGADPKATVYDGGISSTAYGIAIAAELLDAGRTKEAVDFYRDYYARRLAGDASRFPSVIDAADLRKVIGSPAGKRAREALQATFALARAGVVDAYQLHYYEPAELAPRVLDWIRSRLPAGFQIEAWEAGVAWPGLGYTEAEHAAQTARLFGELLRVGVRRAVYLPLAYTPSPDKAPVFRGLVEPDGKELAAAATYRKLVGLTSGAVTLRPFDVDGVEGVVAERDGQASALVWSDRPQGVPLRSVAGLTVADARGTPVSAAVQIGQDPVIVQLRGGADDLRNRLAQALPR